MSETIGQRSSQLRAPQHVDPIEERRARRDERRSPFVPFGEQIEQQLVSCPFERDEPQLVRDQQRRS